MHGLNFVNHETVFLCSVYLHMLVDAVCLQVIPQQSASNARMLMPATGSGAAADHPASTALTVRPGSAGAGGGSQQLQQLQYEEDEEEEAEEDAMQHMYAVAGPMTPQSQNLMQQMQPVSMMQQLLAQQNMMAMQQQQMHQMQQQQMGYGSGQGGQLNQMQQQQMGYGGGQGGRGRGRPRGGFGSHNSGLRNFGYY